MNKIDHIDIRDHIVGKVLNENIINKIELLIRKTEEDMKSMKGDVKKSNSFRLIQFKKALDGIKHCNYEIKTYIDARKINGIGDGIAKRIVEIINTGTLAELQQEHILTKEDKALKDLCSVSGIGEVRAIEYIKMGITSISGLINAIKNKKIKPTHHILIGLKYYDDINERIPREEIVKIELAMKESLKKYDITINICGSYRRLLNDSGDIDVLMSSPNDNINLTNIIEELKKDKIIIDDLTMNGNTKYMGICKSSNNNAKGRRIDIRMVKNEQYYPALLYFTGSANHNKIMRQIAVVSGYKLNEYCLMDQDGIPIKNIKSEKDIYDILKIVYLEPHERNL